MRLISNEELLFVSGGDGEHEIQPISDEELTMAMDSLPTIDSLIAGGSFDLPEIVMVQGYKDRDNTLGEFSCHLISGGLGLTAAILLSETGPIAIAAAEYVISKVDSACVDYIYAVKK